MSLNNNIVFEVGLLNAEDASFIYNYLNYLIS